MEVEAPNGSRASTVIENSPMALAVGVPRIDSVAASKFKPSGKPDALKVRKFPSGSENAEEGRDRP